MGTRRRTRRSIVALITALGLLGCDAVDQDADDTADTAERPEGVDGGGEGDGADGVTDRLRRDTSDVAAGFEADPACFGIEPVGLEANDVECGTVEVPEHHDDPDGGSIQLAVAVFAGSDADAYERPLLLLGGGPGEVMIEPALTTPAVRELFDVGPDLIVVDQRGVGSSTPSLACPEVPDAAAGAASVDEFLDVLDDCRAGFADDGVDLDAYTHVENAHDVGLVRRALGHEQIDVRGGSYGSQLALLAAEADPEGVHSLILSSPVDPRRNWVDGAAAGFASAIERLAAACAADDACDESFGDLEATIASTVDRLADEPREVTVQPPGGEEVTATYDPVAYLEAVFLMFYVPDGPAVLPAMLAAADAGRLEPLAQVVALVREQLEGAVSTGMQFSMVCSGEGAHASGEAALAELDSPVIAEHWVPDGVIGGEVMERACGIWDVEEAYDPAEVELTGDVPALIVTGAFDHVTPPELGESVAADFDIAHLVEVPTAGHGALEVLGACGSGMVAQFLADPHQRPDDDCAVRRPVRFLTQLPFGR